MFVTKSAINFRQKIYILWPMIRPSLSVVIPAFNEEHSLAYVLSDTLHQLPKIISKIEILVVNDGSTDNTLAIAKYFARKNKRVKVVNIRHSGFNNAFVAGLKRAQGEYVTYMQADGQDLVRDMVNCYASLPGSDLVLGTRGKRIDYDPYRLILSYGGLILYRLLFGIKHDDVHWIYFWRRSELAKIKLNPNSGMFMLVETLVRFSKKGLTIREAPAPYRPRFAGASKNSSPSVVAQTLISMTKFWWKLSFGQI